MCMCLFVGQCGVILGLLLMLSSAWLTDVACRFLVKTAFSSKKRSYEYLGKSPAVLVTSELALP